MGCCTLPAARAAMSRMQEQLNMHCAVGCCSLVVASTMSRMQEQLGMRHASAKGMAGSVAQTGTAAKRPRARQGCLLQEGQSQTCALCTARAGAHLIWWCISKYSATLMSRPSCLARSSTRSLRLMLAAMHLLHNDVAAESLAVSAVL